MSKTWLIVDDETEIGALLAALGTSGQDVTALVVGSADTAERTSSFVSDVRWIDASGSPAEAFADAVVATVESAEPSLVVGGSDAGSRTLTGTAVARLGVPLVSNVIAVRASNGSVEVDRSAVEDQIIVTSQVRLPAGLLVAPTGSDVELQGTAGTVTSIQATPSSMDVVASQPAPSSGLKDAECIVAVGMGLGSAEALIPVEALASALGAELGCSMPVADDMGWMPTSRYIGVSGQKISPDLYLALGISGTPQHLAGTRNAKTVVAVNNDPKAPIFKVSDYGIVADLQEVVPALTEALGATD